MDNPFLAISLLALSTVLIVAEVFIPSGGLLGIGTFLSLGASFYFAWNAWWETAPMYFISFAGFAIIFLPSVLIASVMVLPYTSFGRRILLVGPTEDEVVPFSEEEKRLKALVGRLAVAVTPLTPNGFIEIDGERINASSETVIIDAQTKVKVTKVAGTRVLVREANQEDLEPNESPASLETADSEIDFDIPEA